MYKTIDLFSGAGGFSLGLEKAGLSLVGAVDLNLHAARTYKHNFSSHPIFAEDLQTFTPKNFSKETGCGSIDVIVGGPPCQGFSSARTGNHGLKFVEDKRRILYEFFLDYVKWFQPKIFVMENVPGIKTAVGGTIWKNIETAIKNTGYTMHTELLQAQYFGVPQKRRRIIIVGFRGDVKPFEVSTGNKWVKPTHFEDSQEGLKKVVKLWDAIGDLPLLKAGTTRNTYDLKRRKEFTDKYGGQYLKDVVEIDRSDQLTGHEARPHMERDLRDFDRLRQGESSQTAIQRGEEMEYPYSRERFKDRYTRQSQRGLSSTIVAHLSKDGLMFIHPTQNRSFTPREAARIQSFPDWFEFPVPRTHQFTLIGNAVPPLMGKAIGSAVIEHLRISEKGSQKKRAPSHSL